MRRWAIGALVLLGAQACAGSSGVAPDAPTVTPSWAESSDVGSPEAAPSIAVLGTCRRMAEAALAPAPPVQAPAECVSGSAALQNELGPLFAQAVQDGDQGLVVHVDFPRTAVRAEPAQITALVVGGHGALARVVGISSSGPGTFGARVMRVLAGGGPNQIATGPVEFFRRELSESTVTRVFDRMRMALAARITSERQPPAKPDQIELGPFGISSANSSIELGLRDVRGGVATRAWSGYGGSIGAESRVPVELARQTLGEVAVESTAFAQAEAEDRKLLSEVWLQAKPGFERPWYVTQALLILAAQAGSPELIPSITKQLDATDAGIQRLAVDALAAISGHDTRRDASGKERTLGDVVAEYRRECSGP